MTFLAFSFRFSLVFYILNIFLYLSKRNMKAAASSSGQMIFLSSRVCRKIIQFLHVS